MKNIYLLDSNFFIQAHRSSYPFDVATGFWNKIIYLANEGAIASIIKVKEEIYRNEDELKSWCKLNLPDNFFLDLSLESLKKYVEICKWAQSNSQYKQSAKDIFMDEERADAFLVAFAATDIEKWTIVTQEASAPYSKSNIKLPDVCKIYNVKCLNAIQMFRELGERF